MDGCNCNFLAAANEQLRKLKAEAEAEIDRLSGGWYETNRVVLKRDLELTAERDISDKLEKALKIAERFVDRHSESWYISGQQDLATIRTALAEVEAIRKGEQK